MYQGTYYDRNLKAKFNVQISINSDGFEIYNSEFSTKVTKEQVYSAEQRNKNHCIVKIGKDFPFSILEVESEEFSERFKLYFSHIKSQKNIEKKGYSILLGSFILGVTILILAFLFGLPILGEYLATLIPKDQEIKLGESYYQSYKATFKVDTAKTRVANQIFKTLDFGSEYPLQITVVDDHIKNAFALPGGHIVVYNRIIQDMKNSGELVALIAHESTHINKRHTTRSVGRAAGRTMVIAWVLGDYGGLAEVGRELIGLSYSRELEEEADNIGLQTMIKNKIDPQGMVDLLENLKKDSPEMPEALKYMSTHPLTDDRIANVKKQIVPNVRYASNAAVDRIFGSLKDGSK